MSTSDWIMVSAILLAPILAVQIQKHLELIREKRKRKLNIFHTLMATRGNKISQSHVQSLNMIDIEFYGNKIFGIQKQNNDEKAIVEAWKLYHDQLNTKYDEDELAVWIAKCDDLFVELLYKMSKGLGYDFDKVQLKRGIYTPIAHGEQEIALITIRDQLVKILTGNQPLPMSIVDVNTTEEDRKKQELIQQGLIEYLDGKRIVKMKICSDDPKKS